ncbi:iron-siderophore ABC transporter permease [Burkholderia plantarii]|uniref:ABC transport system, permease protein n=2 Tax=Burkholderia plantarii TaxID=41899 RepID=A0A0B6RM48_BURPL|nr:ABC transport system, permease protein [Burkholderia plantarii]ALK30517.1 ABC Fe3+-siderophore transporter, inner membrane subunit [Burkholderia plantarii]WLE59211.1 iron chelate uptake ABC transporter family permease subunit [Burkholderia plantarii]GLZ19801.1 iron-siderophore ABC transporter permease [Burkholderia plantarii]
MSAPLPTAPAASAGRDGGPAGPIDPAARPTANPMAHPMANPRAHAPDEGHARRVYARLTRRRVLCLAAIALLIVASLLFDLSSGPSGLPLATLLRTIFSPAGADPANAVIVWQIRLPYAVMALVVGAALGLSGAEMQTTLNNPLASPYTLGVSAAAAFGASLAIVLDVTIPHVPQTWVISANAFVFAFASAMLLDLVARWRGMSTAGVVLMGIALVFSFHALVELMQFIASADALQGLVFWTLGSLARADWPKIGVLAAALAIALPLSMRNAWALTALRLGEERAASFGIDVRRLRLGTLLRVAVLSALAVSFVGTIGFVGLIAPHIARALLGEDHRFYLPGSLLCGALMLSLASIASKLIVPGVLIPVGIVTALVGIPLFLAIVVRSQGGSQ